MRASRTESKAASVLVLVKASTCAGLAALLFSRLCPVTVPLPVTPPFTRTSNRRSAMSQAPVRGTSELEARLK